MCKSWIKIKKILNPNDSKAKWLGSHCGASFLHTTQIKGIYELFVTGRDLDNCSQIGRLKLIFNNKQINVDYSDSKICFTKGNKGDFDQDGVAYPWFIKKEDGATLMYYVGWKKGTRIPFKNNIGIALYKNGLFERFSKEALHIKNEKNPFGLGSCAIDKRDDGYLMWYTCFKKWNEDIGNYSPKYSINVAKSQDGLNWEKIGENIFHKTNNDCECRPTFLRNNEKYEMWFSARGNDYKIYKSISSDGLIWEQERQDIKLSDDGWDSKGMSYPYVFNHENNTYMIYSGNKYGKGGLGIAMRKKK